MSRSNFHDGELISRQTTTPNNQELRETLSVKMSSQSLKPHIAHTILSRAHSPETAESLFTERVKQKPLFLSPTTATAADNRERRRLQRLRKKEYFLRKQKPQPLSAREKRATGVHRLDSREMKYDVFAGLHWMWVEYMQDLLELKRPYVVNQAVHGSKLASADYHGAELEVVRSRCVGRVGSKGIVVRDSKFAFVLINKKNQCKSRSFCPAGCGYFVFHIAMVTHCISR